MPSFAYPPAPEDVIYENKKVTRPWLAFFQALGTGVGSSAVVILGAVSAMFPNGRVVTDTASVTWDLSTPGELKATAFGGTASNVAEAFFFGGL